MGNLCADPELKYLPKGTAVCQFNLAINREWKNEVGEKKKECVFIGVKAWGKQAETISQYLKKGRPLFVEGRLTQEEWNDKTTNAKRSKTLVTLESFQFLDSGKWDDSGTQQSSSPSDGMPEFPKANVSASLIDNEGDDCPF